MPPIEIIDNFFKIEKLESSKLSIDNFIGYKILPENLLNVLKFLKENKELRFTILTDLFAADFPERDKRFEVVYSLLSLKLNTRILLKIEVAEDEPVNSLTSIYSAACWYEREIFDMFGIEFKDSPDLRRILTDYGFKGHPLRKDFPLTGHVQVRYDETLEKVIYETVLLEQEFRNFDFTSPWHGPEKNILPGDEKATKQE